MIHTALSHTSAALHSLPGSMRSAAGSPSADQENDARVASALSNEALAEARVATAVAEARAVKAEAEARVVKAEADAGARAVKAEADARAVKAEADARVATAEASARVAHVEKQLEHERLLRQARAGAPALAGCGSTLAAAALTLCGGLHARNR
jgi:flotillin